MKRSIIFLLSMFIVTPLLAQEETIVGDNFHSGGYGGPVWKVGFFNGEDGILSGGRGAWIINHKFTIGGGRYGLITDVKSDAVSNTGKSLYIDLDYGGFEMEYIHKSDKLFHWTTHTMLGGGKVRLLEHNPVKTIETEKFFIVEPSLNMDINVSRWFRIGIGASYRIVMGLDLEEISNSDISGPSGLLILKFGAF